MVNIYDRNISDAARIIIDLRRIAVRPIRPLRQRRPSSARDAPRRVFSSSCAKAIVVARGNSSLSSSRNRPRLRLTNRRYRSTTTRYDGDVIFARCPISPEDGSRKKKEKKK